MMASHPADREAQAEAELDGLPPLELKERLLAANKQIRSLKKMLKQEKKKNESLRKKLPVGSYTTSGNSDQLESSIWGVLDRHRDRLFSKAQEQEELPPATTFMERAQRFAQPRKTKSVRVCMNGKWVSVKPWMGTEKQAKLRAMPRAQPPCEGKMVKAYKSAICVQPKEVYDYPVTVAAGCLVHWEWNLEEPDQDVGFELKQGGLLGARTLRWDGMMANDTLGRYKGSCTGKWAGQSGHGASDSTKVVFAWDNLESTVKKTITFHIRVFRLPEEGAGAPSTSFAIDDEVGADLQLTFMQLTPLTSFRHTNNH
jgi:hypothetical protein